MHRASRDLRRGSRQARHHTLYCNSLKHKRTKRRICHYFEKTVNPHTPCCALFLSTVRLTSFSLSLPNSLVPDCVARKREIGVGVTMIRATGVKRSHRDNIIVLQHEKMSARTRPIEKFAQASAKCSFEVYILKRGLFAIH